MPWAIADLLKAWAEVGLVSSRKNRIITSLKTTNQSPA